MRLSIYEQMVVLGLVPVLWLGLWLGWYRRVLRRAGAGSSEPFPTGRDMAAIILDGASDIRAVDSAPFDLYDPWRDVVRLSRRTADGADGLSLAAAALEASHARIGRKFRLFEVARAAVYLGLRLGGAGVVVLALGFIVLGGEAMILEGLKLLALATLGPLALWPFEAVALPGAKRLLPPEHRRTLLIWSLARAWFPLWSARANLPVSEEASG